MKNLKNKKGITLVKLIIIVAIIIAIISIISRNSEIKRKATIQELNDGAASYNLDILKRNKIIVTAYPDAPDNLLYKELKRIPLETANSENYDMLMEAYYSEQTAVMDFNDALLDYYRTILE